MPWTVLRLSTAEVYTGVATAQTRRYGIVSLTSHTPPSHTRCLPAPPAVMQYMSPHLIKTLMYDVLFVTR